MVGPRPNVPSRLAARGALRPSEPQALGSDWVTFRTAAKWPRQRPKEPNIARKPSGLIGLGAALTLAALGASAVAPLSAGASVAPKTTLLVASEGVKNNIPTMTGTLTLVNPAQGKTGFEAKIPSLPTAIAVLPNGGAYVAGVGSDVQGLPGSVTPVSATGVVGKPIKVPSDSMAAAATPNGKTVYVLGGLDAATQPPSTPGTLTPVSTATNKPAAVIKVAPNPSGMTMALNGSAIYVLGQKTASEVATASGKVTSLRVAANAVVVSPDSKWAYFSVPGKLAVQPVNASTHALAKPIDMGDSVPQALAVSPTGKDLYVLGTPAAAMGGDQSDRLTVISTSSDKVVKTINVGSFIAALGWTVKVTPDGKSAVVLSWGTGKGQASLIAVSTATFKTGPVLEVGVAAEDFTVGANDLVYVLDLGTSNKDPGGIVTVDLASASVGKLIKVPALAGRLGTAP